MFTTFVDFGDTPQAAPIADTSIPSVLCLHCLTVIAAILDCTFGLAKVL